jgi:hypothetical protein
MTGSRSLERPCGSKKWLWLFLFLTIHMSMFAQAASVAAASDSSAPIKATGGSSPWYQDVEIRWGGYLKARGSLSWVESDSILGSVDAGRYVDGDLEGRLKNTILGAGGRIYLETHYEAVLLGGDTWRNQRQLQDLYPGVFGEDVFLIRPLQDDRQLMDLSAVIKENDNYVLYHRLDRLALTFLPSWGQVRLGRQAVTWGNGFLFNPMDLFDPFSPTDIERDYKVGTDMAFSQVRLGDIADFQALYVPRRDPSDNHVKWDQSSLAGKFHFSFGGTEFDIMASHHYDAPVVGIGSRGYFKEAAWRLDATWTFVDHDSGSDYLSLDANVDYSWVWIKKNWYGFIEYFYSGVGRTDYTKAIVDPQIVERIDRGELFTLGKYYLSGHVRVELHPLFNLSLTAINNLSDPSGVLQPYAVWDMTQNLELTFGGNIYWGSKDTEFGGFKIPGLPLSTNPADKVFVWLSYYF